MGPGGRGWRGGWEQGETNKNRNVQPYRGSNQGCLDYGSDAPPTEVSGPHGHTFPEVNEIRPDYSSPFQPG